MNLIEKLKRVYGLNGGVGVFLSFIAVALMSGTNLFKNDFLLGGDPVEITGIVIYIVALFFLTAELTQQKREVSLGPDDKSILKTEVLSTLNRDAINNTEIRTEDIRAQFSSLTQIKRDLQKSMPKLSNDTPRLMVKALTQALKELDKYNHWRGEVDYVPNREQEQANQEKYNKWYEELGRSAPDFNTIHGSTPYYKAFYEIQNYLAVIRAIVDMLNRMAN